MHNSKRLSQSSLYLTTQYIFNFKMGVQETCPNQLPITKAFLEKVLKKKVVDFHASGGSNPGDNFTSILVSLEVTLADEKEPLHLLFKTFPQHPTRQKLLEESNLFLKEYQVYNEFLPELVNFQKTTNGKALLKPAMPEMVAGAAHDYANGDASTWKDVDPMLSNFILMVDMRKTHGYKMANKLKSQGYTHAKLVLDELAKYHALGHAYKTKTNLVDFPSKFPYMEDPFFCNPAQKPTLAAMMKGNFELINNTLKDFLQANPQIAEGTQKILIPELVADYFAMFLDKNGVDENKVESLMRQKPMKYEDSPPLKEQWLVAGHGDAWTNNMLFKYNEAGKPTAVCLVDLQVCRQSCIMADIVYFLYTSTDTEFRAKYLEEMLSWYYERFLHYCKHLEVPPFPGFSLENFQRKFHRSKIVGLAFACMVLPIILQKPETTVNMDTMEVDANGNNTGEEFAAMFQKLGRDEDDTKMLRERFEKLFTEMYEEGVL